MNMLPARRNIVIQQQQQQQQKQDYQRQQTEQHKSTQQQQQHQEQQQQHESKQHRKCQRSGLATRSSDSDSSSSSRSSDRNIGRSRCGRSHQRSQRTEQRSHHRYHHKWQHVLFRSWLTFWVCLACLLCPALPEVIYRVDPLALLAATLRTYQRAGCDSEQLSLSCPRGTSISIELAQYGRAGDLSDHSLCPPVSQEDLTTTGSSSSGGSSSGGGGSAGSAGGSGSDSVIHSGTEIEVKPPETCTVSGLQYALLQTVVDACQKKRHCKFAANPKTSLDAASTGNRDPCSGIRKFVEIAYKCRPYEFRSKVACENDNMPLVCNPYSRIAIYSASFGHIERESVQCGQGQQQQQQQQQAANTNSVDENSKQTCLVSYATETVMQICHGRRRCSITADAGTFGRPCKNDVRMYLKVVYTCIPRKVLKDRYETAAEADEPQQSELDMDQDELYDEDQFYKESEAIPPAPKIQGAIPNPAFPYDIGVGTYGGGSQGGGGGGSGATSTLLPPLLSRNDSSLEAAILPTAIVSELASEPTDTTTAATDFPPTDETSEDSAAIAIINDGKVPGNFIERRKCQMSDDWGPFGFNCTEADMSQERVQVVGFLVNWAQAYIHIRKNQEQFYLYLIISVAAGVLLCLTLVIGRLTLQRRRGTTRKNSNSASNNEKTYSDSSGAANAAAVSGKYQPGGNATGETQLPGNSFGDDISDIDADIDLTSPMPVPSLSSRNETYITYAPTPNCSYGSMPPPTSGSYATATTMLMPHHGGGLPLSSAGGHAKVYGGPLLTNSTAGRQGTPPPGTALYTSMGGVGVVGSPTVSGTLTMGPHMLTPAALNAAAAHSNAAGGIAIAGGAPSYLSGSIMVPGHHHAHVGTLRRTLVPGASIGVMGAGGGTAVPTSTMTAMVGAAPHSMAGIPSAASIYYDTTMPRNLQRGMSADNSAQYFYG